MDRGAWWAIVHGGHKRVGNDLVTEQQQQSSMLITYNAILYVSSCEKWNFLKINF